MAAKSVCRFCPGFARFAVPTKRFDKKNNIQSNCFSCCPCKCIQDYKCLNEYPEDVDHESKYSSVWPGDYIKGPECYSVARRKLNQKPKWITYFPKNCIQHVPWYERSSSNLFRHLNPRKRSSYEYPDLFHGRTNTLEYLRGLPRSFFFRRHKNDDDKKKPRKRIPKLILLQNPFTWLMTKVDFSILRRIWDPSFSEKDFKFGTTQAISKVTNVISAGQYAELNGLLTKAARLSLMRELDRNWSDKQRSLLSLNRDDIQICTPRKVYFIKIADKKYCDVDMAFLALKWTPINSIEALIFTEIFARFHREYTPHCIPEWTIAYFKVTRFEVLRRKPRGSFKG